MSSRFERRKAKRELKWKLSNPVVRHILQAELESGSGTETYRLDDDGFGRPMYFNISAMRRWAESHIEPGLFPLDFERAHRLVKSGAVDINHLESHTIRTDLRPIIVCRGVGIAKSDQIVDRAHRFVALHIGSAMFGIDGGIPGYLLRPAEWQKFVVANRIAERLFKS